ASRAAPDARSRGPGLRARWLGRRRQLPLEDRLARARARRHGRPPRAALSRRLLARAAPDDRPDDHARGAVERESRTDSPPLPPVLDSVLGAADPQALRA